MEMLATTTFEDIGPGDDTDHDLLAAVQFRRGGDPGV